MTILQLIGAPQELLDREIQAYKWRYLFMKKKLLNMETWNLINKFWSKKQL